MTLKAQIQEDIKTAMKAREKERLDTLRGLMSEIKKREIDTRTELTEDQVKDTLQKETKKRRDALEFAEKAGRAELVQQNEQEIALIQGYLGKQLTEDELRALIQQEIDGGADSIGPIMGKLNKDYKGQFDGKTASGIVKELLG
ncbi:MAG: GatB/YqeY domain-containing protein [Bdellovibrionales bacterium]|nr:GatB/YqeY domain-containing protein [Bdellovibrionales bacterium]